MNPNRTLRPGNYFLLLLTSLALAFSACKKDEVEIYLPRNQDQAIAFTHKFNPEDYTEGKDIVINGFSQAIRNSGQTRRTYFMSRPDSSEVFVISVFHPGSSTNEWLDSEGRDAVLAQLRPLYREPLKVQTLTADLVHDTHTIDPNVPEYLPEPGDQVLLFIHLFNPTDHETGTEIVVDEFSEAIKNSGQTRRTYFLNDPDSSGMLVPSFFHPGSSTEAWLDAEVRQEILSMLYPLYREPLQVNKYTVDRIFDTN